jgi:hypothetical protein
MRSLLIRDKGLAWYNILQGRELQEVCGADASDSRSIYRGEEPPISLPDVSLTGELEIKVLGNESIYSSLHVVTY